MHELALAESVLELIDDAARAEGFRHVRKVVLEIGQLAAVEAEAMRFCFDAVVRDTLADGAFLEIEAVPATGRCGRCGATVAMEEPVGVCPHCGGSVKLRSGREMRLKSLEVE